VTYYTDIGMGKGDGDLLWMLNDAGNIVVKPAKGNDHTSAFGGPVNYNWHGRYDAGKNIVSVTGGELDREHDEAYVRSVLKYDFPGASIRFFKAMSKGSVMQKTYAVVHRETDEERGQYATEEEALERCAQLGSEYEVVQKKSKPDEPTYYDVGHSGSTVLWYMTDAGNIETAATKVNLDPANFNIGMIHSDLTPGRVDRTWHGRYDEGSGTVSIAGDDGVHDEAYVRSVLKQEFPGAKIRTFKSIVLKHIGKSTTGGQRYRLARS